MLVYALIVVFSILLVLSFSPTVEGLTTTGQPTDNTYKPYAPNDALILSQQNAGNIQVLKGQIDDLEHLERRVSTAEDNINALQQQMDSLANQQAEYAQEMAGNTPPTITGTEEDEEE